MMMRVIKTTAFVLCVAVLAATQVSAADPFEVRDRKPGMALAAAGLNLFYVPVRLIVTIVGAELSGLTGFLTLGNQEAAGDVASVFDGTHYLSPAHVEGSEPVRFGPPEFP